MSEGIFDKMKYLIGIEDVEDDDEDEYEEPRRVEREYARPVPATITPKESKIVNYQQKAHMKLVLHEPDGFDECQKIVDNLKNKKPVIVNLEKVEAEVGKRIFDFVNGAIYAINGSVQKVANGIFVFAPDNVDISSNFSMRDRDPSPKSSIFK